MRFAAFSLVPCQLLVAISAAQSAPEQQTENHTPPQVQFQGTPDLAHANQLLGEGKYEQAIAELKALPPEQPGVARAQASRPSSSVQWTRSSNG
jgi:hypothetical protein